MCWKTLLTPIIILVLYSNQIASREKNKGTEHADLKYFEYYSDSITDYVKNNNYEYLIDGYSELLDDDNDDDEEDDPDYDISNSLMTDDEDKKKCKGKVSKTKSKQKKPSSIKKKQNFPKTKLNLPNSIVNENIDNKDVETDNNIAGYTFIGHEAVCSLKLNYDISKINEPLFMVKDKSGSFHLAFPDLIAKEDNKYNSGTGAIQFDTEEAVYVACPGKDNSLKGSDPSNHAISAIKCFSGSKVFLHTEEVDKLTDSSQLTCQKPVVGSAIFGKGKKSCGNGEGVLIELGFLVEGWHKLIDVCFNVDEIRTLYAKHKLYGSILAGAVIDSNRPKFSKGDDNFYNGFNPNEFYKKENEKQTIYELTGVHKYFNASSNLYLARGHFAPDADFIFKAWQDLTYFYVNVAPQWQSINQGHWLSVERLTRNLAMKLGEDLDIVTGSLGIMKIKGKELHLKINDSEKKRKSKKPIPKLAVPDYYWKLLHRPSKNECVVIISTNNPFIDEPIEFCEDISRDNSWPQLKDSKKGFIFCCRYDDFRSTVTTVEDYNCTGGVLKGLHVN